MSIETRLVTARKFWLMPGDRKHRELVRGEAIEAMPPGGLHGFVASESSSRLRIWARSGPGGYVGVEAGFVLARNPDTVRGPDVSYVRAERIPETGIPEALWELAPDLAVEVVSPGDHAGEVREKVREYLVSGTQLVWEIHPRTREVIEHEPDGNSRAYSGQDQLENPEVLPGFSCVVDELFG